MDCMKVGGLISRLRKEKHMTQKELADAMNISDKAVSKWERGLVRLYPEQGAELRFPRMYRGRLFYYCSRHGLRVRNL